VPALHLAVATTDGLLRSWAISDGETRAVSLLHAGILPVADDACPDPGLVEARDDLCASGRCVLERIGAPTEVHRAFEAAVGALRASDARRDDAERADAARSAAERFLFDALACMPETRGLFLLNADPGFPFGGRAAEVDLLAPAARVAIEIDGRFHFLDAERFRRDRRKDLALQVHGFLVLRFLADDVVSRLEEILSTVVDAIARRA
jgi:hypothetical protein